MIAEHFDEVNVLFSEIFVGFTNHVRTKPQELVKLLNMIFLSMISSRTGTLEKIKPLGRLYGSFSSVPVSQVDLCC
ncbi:MAG: adenylate/guanylate cyclase domain-containing protein [Thiotrichaceae bacterium]